MGFTALAAQVVECVKPYVVAVGGTLGGAVGGGALASAGKDLWAWLKGKLTRPVQAAAVSEAAAAPADPLNWDALKVQLIKALRDDAAFREELLSRLPKEVQQRFAPQAADAAGNGAAIAQAQGQNINIQINRPGG